MQRRITVRGLVRSRRSFLVSASILIACQTPLFLINNRVCNVNFPANSSKYFWLESTTTPRENGRKVFSRRTAATRDRLYCLLRNGIHPQGKT